MNGSYITNNIDKMFNNVNVFVLPNTYRCSRSVTMMGNKVAKILDGSQVETMNNNLGQTSLERLFDGFSDEVNWIVDKAINHRQNQPQSQIRVLFRTNLQSLRFQVKFMDKNIPFIANQNHFIFESKEAKIMLGLLKLVNENIDELGHKEIQEMMKHLKYVCSPDVIEGWHLFVWDIGKYKTNPLTNPQQYVKYLDKINEVNKIAATISHLTPPQILKWLINNKIESIEKAINGATDTFEAFCDFFKDCNDVDEVKQLIDKISFHKDYDGDENPVILSTIHSSKGLESDIVFLCGVADNLFPSKFGDPDEELRLLYVGVTRAKSSLYVTGCYSYGSRTFNKHSFIDILT